jgi:hypothetical protein
MGLSTLNRDDDGDRGRGPLDARVVNALSSASAAVAVSTLLGGTRQVDVEASTTDEAIMRLSRQGAVCTHRVRSLTLRTNARILFHS